MYWKIVTGNIKKDSSGLIAISSILGWLVNGQVAGTAEKSVNVVKSVLSIQGVEDEKKSLAEKIGNFWDLDLIGIKDEEPKKNDVIGAISLKKGRYEVELPFREGHPPLADIGQLYIK